MPKHYSLQSSCYFPLKPNMSTATVTRPVTFRLPKPGVSDVYFGFSRSYFYSLDKLFFDECGEGLLIHVTTEGRTRGVTLVPFDMVEQFVRCLASGQSLRSAIIEAMKKTTAPNKNDDSEQD